MLDHAGSKIQGGLRVPCCLHGDGFATPVCQNWERLNVRGCFALVFT